MLESLISLMGTRKSMVSVQIKPIQPLGFVQFHILRQFNQQKHTTYIFPFFPFPSISQKPNKLRIMFSNSRALSSRFLGS
jgi:hypothetical protein